MISIEKQNFIREAARVHQSLVWMAQFPDESIDKFCYRHSRAHSLHLAIPVILKENFEELVLTVPERIKLAITTLIRGVKPSIRRYMCDPEFYTTYQQCEKHAKDIERHLNDLNNLSVIYPFCLNTYSGKNQSSIYGNQVQTFFTVYPITTHTRATNCLY